VAEAVVRGTALGVGEHLVGLGRLPEAPLRVRRVADVRVQLPGERAERPLDLLVGCATPDAEDLVVIPLRGRHCSVLVVQRLDEPR
jgi:hypothetical protein